jgi:hypothetical protein
VHPSDDDMQHLTEGHEPFRASPAGKAMSKEMVQAHEQHVRDHHAQAIRKAAARVQQQQAPMGPPQLASTPQGAMARMGGAPQ